MGSVRGTSVCDVLEDFGEWWLRTPATLTTQPALDPELREDRIILVKEKHHLRPPGHRERRPFAHVRKLLRHGLMDIVARRTELVNRHLILDGHPNHPRRRGRRPLFIP